MTEQEGKQENVARQTALVVGAIADPEMLQKKINGCDIIELRLDSLGIGPDVLAFAKEAPLPLLVTARGPIEGGQNDWTPADRAEAYLKLLPYSRYIDIELRDFDALADTITAAKASGVTVIGSFHDFTKTPQLSELTSKFDPRADLLKFALMVNDAADIQTHLSLIDNLAKRPFSLMGMGPLGAAARPLMAKAGSLLNYGYLGETPTAPNQWPVSLLKQTLSL